LKNKKNSLRAIIAIDGPAGSGKSSVTKIVSKELGFSHLDTGAMYRSVTYFCLKNNLSLKFLGSVEINDFLKKNFDLKITKENKVFLNDQDISSEIRQPEINRLVSKISSYPEIRKYLVSLQRKLGSLGKVILDGRDIGTTVFPNADLKIFLTASIKERAKRRHKQQISEGIKQKLQEIEEEIRKRDQEDQNRKTSPLKIAEDAILIETDFISIQQVVDKIKELASFKNLS